MGIRPRDPPGRSFSEQREVSGRVALFGGVYNTYLALTALLEDAPARAGEIFCLGDVGAFGPQDEIPDSIRGAEVRFQFESPLHRALEREKSARFQEGAQLLLEAAQIDPKSAAVFDVHKALRDALTGAGVPAKWLRDEDEVEAMAAAAEAQEKLARVAALAEQGGKAGKEIAQAEQASQQAALF